jgi:aryl-alcohol dehydrogenase-like predicted oxidoreductase
VTPPVANERASWSPIGLGTWAMGGQGWRYSWGRQDDAQSAATIVRAVELGIDWIDTAPVYGVGHAEAVVGRTLAEHRLRPRVRLASKCGFLWQPGSRRPYPRLTAASVFAEVEASLRRLRTDYLDLYQIHWPGPDCDIDAAWESIGRLIEQGKVVAGGVCNLAAADLQRLHAARRVATLQLPYHLLDRAGERELLPRCAHLGVAVLAYSPLASGILTEAFDARRRRRLPGDDWRSRAAAFNEPHLSRNLQTAAALRRCAAARGVRAEALAIAWAAGHPAVRGVIVGARTAQQIGHAAEAANVRLDGEARRLLATALEHAAGPAT